MKTQTTILILAANPRDTDRLRLEEEVREIELGLQFSARREHFQLQQKWAVRAADLRRALLTLKPDIVHFSGHGEGKAGLILENADGHSHLVTASALGNLFKLFSEQINCVLLNSCYSVVQAEVIAEHIDYVIGIHSAISDKASIEFAVAFYDGLGAGESIEFAFDLACNAIELIGGTETNLPILLGKKVQHHVSPNENDDDSLSQKTIKPCEINDVHFLYQEKVSLLTKWKELGEQVLQLETHLETNPSLSNQNRHIVEKLLVLRRAEFESYLDILQIFMPTAGNQKANVKEDRSLKSAKNINFISNPFKNYLVLASFATIIMILIFWNFNDFFKFSFISNKNYFSTSSIVSSQGLPLEQNYFLDDYGYSEVNSFSEPIVSDFSNIATIDVLANFQTAQVNSDMTTIINFYAYNTTFPTDDYIQFNWDAVIGSTQYRVLLDSKESTFNNCSNDDNIGFYTVFVRSYGRLDSRNSISFFSRGYEVIHMDMHQESRLINISFPLVLPFYLILLFTWLTGFNSLVINYFKHSRVMH